MPDLLFFCNWVAGFGQNANLKKKAFNFKMAMGIIIMGFGFLFMVLLCNLKNQDLQV
jgi:dipeptide/tripeptide permease